MRLDLARFDSSTFDRGVSRWKEGLWWGVRALFFSIPFPLPSVVKVFWLRRFGATVGEGVVIRGGVNITFPWRLRVGDHVWIGDEVLILSLAPVEIGNHVCISQRAFLCTGSHDHRKESFDLLTKPITVGDGCWIAAQTFVGAGVSIGTGSVVAAGAVIVKDVPAMHLARGNPAIVERMPDAG